MHHANGQAKYLEQPARSMSSELAGIAHRTISNGGSLEDGLRAAGEALLKAAQAIVPVDTGVLRDSGYVKVG